MNPTDPLAELRGLSMPAPPLFDWWPLSIGWWIVLLLIVVVAYLIARYVKRMIADNWYKQALLELEAIRTLERAADINDQDLLIRCSTLCRRVAMAVDGREAIANLTGVVWLQKLDELSNGQDFTTGSGVLLDDRLWQKRPEHQQYTASEVLDVVSRLIKNNKPDLKSLMGSL